MPGYLVCKGKAGLGNRLLSALSSILYAKISGRTLYVDWSDPGYSRNRENSWPSFFTRPVLPDPAVLFAVPSARIAPALWRNNLSKSVDEMMNEQLGPRDDTVDDSAAGARYSIDFRRLDHPEELLVRWCYVADVHLVRPHLRGPWARLRVLTDDELLRTVLREELELHPDIRRRVDEFKARHFSEVNIGLHIRYTDRKNSFDDYPRLVDRVLRQHPGATIFLATDNKQVEQIFRDRYPRVAVTEKWSPDPGTPIHRTRACPDKMESGIEALVDMYLLGACDYLAYNKTSTFGVVASLLSQARKEQLFETSPATETLKSAARWLKRRLG